jgi:uncharacterized protein (DUF3084 family)
MAYTILFVIALILVSGFIAYFGDALGRRMGKKRLTLFNLRPRYTAIVVTTITGMLISALALVALVSVNSQFRKVLFRGEQILARNKQLSAANIHLARRSQTLRLEVARQRREVTKARNDAVLAKAQRDNAQRVVARLQRDIAERQKELAELTKRTNAAEEELSMRRGEVKLAQAELRVAQESLSRAKEQVAETERKLDAVRASLEATQAELKESEKAINYTLRLRTSELAFRQGDELVRGIIDPFQSKFEITRAVYELLERASRKAIEGGAKAGDNGRAVNVIFRKSTGSEGVLLIGNESEWVGKAADKIASSDKDVLVQVVCGMSTLPDAQVPVELRLYLNEIAFLKGDRIARTTIDGRQSEGYILLALNSFLQTDVANAAMRAGVVPVSGQDPRTALGANRQAQADELLRIVAEIKSMDAPADVTVYAAADVFAADSLNIDNMRFTAVKAH